MHLSHASFYRFKEFSQKSRRLGSEQKIIFGLFTIFGNEFLQYTNRLTLGP